MIKFQLIEGVIIFSNTRRTRYLLSRAYPYQFLFSKIAQGEDFNYDYLINVGVNVPVAVLSAL